MSAFRKSVSINDIFSNPTRWMNGPGVQKQTLATVCDECGETSFSNDVCFNCGYSTHPDDIAERDYDPGEEY